MTERREAREIESLSVGSVEEAAAALGRLLAVTQASYERRAQLEHALQSRVAIEQAKGIVAERYGLELDEAFELIRRASRTHRLKLQAFVRRIRPGEPTPPELLAVLEQGGVRGDRLATRARSNNSPHMAHAKRIARNNRIFREANEKIRERSIELQDPVERIPFLCECPREDCATVVPLTAAEYEAIRHERTHFFTIPGHEEADRPVGEIGSRRDGYVLVQKDVERD
jgi:ANTAR domain